MPDQRKVEGSRAVDVQVTFINAALGRLFKGQKYCARIFSVYGQGYQLNACTSRQHKKQLPFQLGSNELSLYYRAHQTMDILCQNFDDVTRWEDIMDISGQAKNTVKVDIKNIRRALREATEKEFIVTSAQGNGLILEFFVDERGQGFSYNPHPYSRVLHEVVRPQLGLSLTS